MTPDTLTPRIRRHKRRDRRRDCIRVIAQAIDLLLDSRRQLGPTDGRRAEQHGTRYSSKP